MANRPALIKQASLAGIAKAMQAAGVPEYRVEIDPSGKVAIIVGTANVARPGKSDWD